MKKRISFHGVTFEDKKLPMSEQRFKNLCLLAGFWMYSRMVCSIAATCGGWGVAVVGVATVLLFLIDKEGF